MSSVVMSTQLNLSVLPQEVQLKVMSFLKDKRDIQALACTCKALNAVADDFQVWKPLVEAKFGKLFAEVKEPKKSWKQLYSDLETSTKTRTENISKVLQTHVKKVETDDIQYRTSKAAAALFGLAAPSQSTHYVPNGQTAFWGNRKVTVYKTSMQ